MKKMYQLLSRVLVVLLVAVIPMAALAQEKKAEKAPRKNAAPTHSYWSVTLLGSANQFNGDLSKNLWFNDKWTFGGGFMVTKQFTRVIGLRLKAGFTPLKSEIPLDNTKYVPGGYDPGYGVSEPGYIAQKFEAVVWESDLHLTVNWLNWILGWKPERVFSSYLIFGAGMDHTKGVKTNLFDGQDIAWIGYDSHKGSENKGVGNNSGLTGWNLEFKAVTGIGFDFNINKHWAISPEFIWRWRDGDALDMTKGGALEIKNDMYSSATLGVSYKFAYSGCSLKDMAKKYDQIKYETTPPILSEKGDSVTVTVKGTVPEKYWCPRAAMYWQPVVKYQGGEYALKPITLIGEKVTGDGTMIRYKEGGTFSYTTVFPYKPEMATSELVVAPTIYDAKEKVIPKKDEIKAKVEYIDLPSKVLAVGIIYTPTRIMLDMLPLIADHGYIKDIIVSKTGIIYFRVNSPKLEMNFGLNKTQPAKDALTQLDNFIKQGWKLKNITIDGWASPEGEETFNANLSANRAKTGNTYMIDQFKKWVKEAEKNNKDKKAVKAKVDAAGSDVNFVVQSHGPDWNGFLKNVQGSTIKDKDKILNVINSAGSNQKKEQEIRNMIVIYPELEEYMLPPLRRAEITANCYQPLKSDQELLSLAVSNPDKLRVDELLYAGTLTNDDKTKLTIYENAARIYPNDWKALNAAGQANLTAGNLDKASSYLTKAATASPNNGIIEHNLGVLAAKQGDLKKAEAQFKKAQQLGENENYALGVLAIKSGDYQKANNLLANAKCTYNLGLAQLVSGNTATAQTTLQCAPQTPDTYYLLAICGARSNNAKALYDNLMKAVVDPKLKEQARGDREFYNFAETQDFKNIVK
jgi:Flp pilus assembly protein TadD/outer membrane protein OmpA-like peptidoglycan-associated protein